jgi:hypothetical protein
MASFRIQPEGRHGRLIQELGMKTFKTLVLVFGVVSLMLSATAARADMTSTFSQGDLAASAKFAVSGSNLVVTLTNTSTADVLVPTAVLTAVFFDLPGGITLSPLSALLGTGSTVFFGPTNGGDVGGEWAYAALPPATPPPPGNAGISSAGLGLFGDANFGGANLQGPVSVDGLQYGITSAGDDTTSGNAAVTGKFALIQNEVVFTLSGVDATFDPGTMISNVQFQYGTSLGEMVVPAPAAALLGAIGLALVAWLKRRSA